MASNSSSPQDKGFEKSAAVDDSADVPVVAVTAELPVDGVASGDTAPLSAQPLLAQAETQAAGGDTSPTPTPPDFLAPLLSNDSADDPARRTPIPESDLEELGEYGELGRRLPAEALSGQAAEILSAVSLDVVREDEREGGRDARDDVFTSAVDLPQFDVHEEPADATGTADSADGANAPVALEAGASSSATDDDSALPEVEFDGESTSLDASDLVIEGEAEAAAELAAADLATMAAAATSDAPVRRTVQGMPSFTGAPDSPDDDFLRRVVLPPLPRVPSRPTASGVPLVPIENNPFDDHTAISAPPSPELLASMAPAPRASGPAMAAPGSRKQRGEKPVRLSYLQLGTLLLLAGVGGGFGSNYLREHQAALGPKTGAVTTPVAAERAPVAAPTPAAAPVTATPPTAPATPAPAAVVPAPPIAKATAGGTPPRAEAARPAARPGKVTKRTRRAKRPPTKKAWVDPFE